MRGLQTIGYVYRFFTNERVRWWFWVVISLLNPFYQYGTLQIPRFYIVLPPIFVIWNKTISENREIKVIRVKLGKEGGMTPKIEDEIRIKREDHIAYYILMGFVVVVYLEYSYIDRMLNRSFVG